jgi:signal transduction histidine kinase
VRDEGIGIPEGEQDRVFDEFVRGSNTDVRPGTGLGLTIVARIVRRLGGRVDLTSAVGKGTTVYVTLPLVGADA